MKLGKRLLFIGTILMLASLFVACDGILTITSDWLSAPYGYVEDAAGTPVAGATVTVYKTSVLETNKVQTAATTTSTGYFTLSSKVDSKGGTYIVVVTAPTDSALQFEETTVIVPDTGYLFGIGTIKALGAFYSISGEVINVRDLESKTGYTKPTTGTVELREFGTATAIKTTTLDSDGTYSLTGIEPGSYLVTFKKATAETATWVGIPISVEVTASNLTDVGALVYKDVSAAAIVLVMTWDNKAYDIDSHVYVGPAPGTRVTISTPLNNATDKVTYERDVVAVQTGAGALSDGSNVIAAGAYPVETTLVESLGSGVELRFFAQAYDYLTTDTAVPSITGLDSGTSSKLPAGLKLYAMFNGEHFGTWFAPSNSDEATIGLVQITGNADGSMTIGTFGGNTARSIGAFYGFGIRVNSVE